MGVADPRVLGHNRDVAQQRVGGGKADRVSIDRRDDRLIEFELARDTSAADHGVVHFPLLQNVATGPFRHRLHVAADTEEVAGTRQQHDIDRVIVGEIVPDRSQFADQLLIDGISRLRPVQCYRCDLVRNLDREAFILGISVMFLSTVRSVSF